MRKFLILALIVSTAVLGGAGYLFYSEIHSSFPDLPPGRYAGALSYMAEGNVPRKVSWLIDKAAPGSEIAAFISDDEIPAQRVAGSIGLDAALPLIVSGPRSRLRFVGSTSSDGIYGGDFLNPITGEAGTWTLSRVETVTTASSDSADLQAWALRWSELQDISQKTANLNAKLGEQRAKIEKLDRFIVDEDALRKKADSRLGMTTEAVQSARTEMSQLRIELDTTLRDIELAQRVSPRGHLVVLSRESIAREAAWIEGSLQLVSPETAPGFEQSLERALRVKSLKDEIALERKRISELETASRYRGEAPETGAEEDFYRNLQN
jgi:hypothetical protein